MSTLDDQPKILQIAPISGFASTWVWSVRPDLWPAGTHRLVHHHHITFAWWASLEPNAVDALAQAEPAGRPGVAEAHVLGGQVRVRPWTVG